MNASEVIQLFIETSGRYNFLDGSDAPTAAAWLLLNDAQKFLDRELGYQKETSYLFKTVSANESLITFDMCRYVKDVHQRVDADTYQRLSWKPAYFDIEYVSEDEEEEPNSHWPTKAIEIDPSESERLVRIQAVWHSPTLSSDTAVSFWTVQEPSMLISAMQMKCERDMRNTQGVRDFYEPLSHDLKKLYHDMIAEEMSGPSEIWVLGHE